MKYLALAMVLPAVALGAEGDILDKVLNFLKSLNDGTVLIVITAAVEFIFRLFKTEKPLSVAWLLAKMAKKLSDVLVKVAELMDKVLPQKVVKPVE